MLNSLMDSLDMGLHQDEVVVPVHEYLPSIKVQRPLSIDNLRSNRHSLFLSKLAAAKPKGIIMCDTLLRFAYHWCCACHQLM